MKTFAIILVIRKSKSKLNKMTIEKKTVTCIEVDVKQLNSHILLRACKMIQSHWKTLFFISFKVQLILISNSATALLGMHPREMKIYLHTESCTYIFLAAA